MSRGDFLDESALEFMQHVLKTSSSDRGDLRTQDFQFEPEGMRLSLE